MQTQVKTNQGNKSGGCDNVISFADFVACMTKREQRSTASKPVNQDENSVIYIGDLR